MVLQNGDDPAGGGQGAVERRDDTGGALGVLRVALASAEPAGLEGRAVRCRGDLAVAALGGDPGLAVELARGRAAEVARGDVDDPVGQLDGREHVLLHGEEPVVLGRGVLDPAVDEHLDLVELVDPVSYTHLDVYKRQTQ